MKIAYITGYDNSDMHAWSGLGYYILKALKEEGHEVYAINNIHLNIKHSLVSKLKGRFYSFLNKGYDFNRDIVYAKRASAYVDAHLQPGTDCIFSPGSLLIAFCKSLVPKVIYTDVCFAGMINFYDSFKNLSAETIKQGNYIEQRALDNCALAIFSSDWAANIAMKYYKVEAGKLRVVPFGANIESLKNISDIKNIVASRSDVICKLLFIGIEWHRKGGNFAICVAEELIKRGMNMELHIVGSEKKVAEHYPDFVIHHGFVSKKNASDKLLLNKLFSESHFFILPTKADCTPVVFSEAAAFGLPCLANNVGGVSTIIRDDVNGKLFSIGDDIKKYADYIELLMRNKTAYAALCNRTLNEYETRLNWKVAGSKLSEHLQSIINHKREAV